MLKPDTSPRISPLPHFNERPQGVSIHTIVIHSLYAPSSSKELDSLSCIDELNNHRVSTHYLIGREGDLWQLVSENHRAWHAGQSSLPAECLVSGGVNDFSIGIELVGKEDLNFTPSQYLTLSNLCRGIISKYPIRHILGHSEVALPLGRKTDPGASFSWAKLRDDLALTPEEKGEIIFSDQLEV